MSDLEHFHYQTHFSVRFADLDVMGHLNHAKYLTYMEQGRVLYVRDVCGFEGTWEEFGVILAKATCDYHMPVAFAETITVYTRCSRLGSKSFDFSYIMQNEKGETVATGLTVLVAFDYASQQTVPVPQAWRERMTDYETGLG